MFWSFLYHIIKVPSSVFYCTEDGTFALIQFNSLLSSKILFLLASYNFL